MVFIKKISKTFLLVLLCFLVGGMSVQATEGATNDMDLSHEAYQSLVTSGTIDSSISYESWVELNTPDSNSSTISPDTETPSNEMDLSFSAYENLIATGSLDSNITYEYWVEVNSPPAVNEDPFADVVLQPNPKDPAPTGAVVGDGTPYSGYLPGDILITTSTSSAGIAGHSAIVLNSTTVIHTSGWKSEPYPLKMSISNWKARYPKVKAIRPISSTLGQTAASKASYYFAGKSIPYRITAGPTSNTYTYCSELVWYSYYKAGKEFKIYDRALGMSVRPSIIAPYDFLNSGDVTRNGFKIIDNVW